MIVHTYTNMWNQERKLYSFYELELPTPISFKQLGLFFGAAVLWMPIMFLIGVKLTTGGPWGFIIWFGPPVALAVLGNRKLFEGKSIIQWGTSMIRFLQQPKRIMDGKGKNMLDKLPKENDEGEIISHEPFSLEYIAWSQESLAKKRK